MQQVEAINLIGTDPEIRSGRPFILGTTITVADIVIAKVFKQMDADAIADDFQLTLAQVYAAFAYYYQNKATIDASIKERRKIAETFKEQRLGSRHKPLFG